MAKVINYLTKMCQYATFARTLNGHNLIISHPKWPSLGLFSSKIISSVSFCLGLGFLGIFCPKASHEQQWAHGPKISLKMLVYFLTIQTKCYSIDHLSVLVAQYSLSVYRVFTTSVMRPREEVIS